MTPTNEHQQDKSARPTNVSATGVVVAATLADDGPTGGFYRDQQPIGW
jgi:hypothetical protein